MNGTTCQRLRWKGPDLAKQRKFVPEREKDRAPVVAIGLLTQRNLDVLGTGFRRAIPLAGAGDFDDLLAAIDEAERRGAAAG
jgi:hypothetical protein